MFVLRSFPRCGTHMIRTALNCWPGIKCHDEVFNVDANPRLLKQTAEAVFLQATSGPEQVGFVAHGYTRERFSGWQKSQELWEKIIPRYQPTVLVLFRRDLLRRAFSLYRARFTNRWHEWNTQAPTPVPPAPKVQAHEVEWQLRVAIESFEASRKLFPQAPMFFYEDFIQNWEKQSTRLLTALGCFDGATATLSQFLPGTRKQNNLPVRQLVANYDELREIFTGTPFEQYFTYAEQQDELCTNQQSVES